MPRRPTSIIEHCSADSPFLTEFRRLLHRIRHLSKEQELKSVLVSSAILSEGKSTVCAILGVTAARKGIKTLIIDCDLRRPHIHHLFRLPAEKGMAEILTRGLAIKKSIKKTSLDKLDIVTSGGAQPQASEILDISLVGDVFSGLKFYYDLILVDSPPIIPVSDPMLLASEVDGVLLVVKAGATRRELVSRAVEIITANGSNVIGTVLNDLSQALPSYYAYDHYSYEYQQTAEPLAPPSDIPPSSGSKDKAGPAKTDPPNKPKSVS